VVFDSLSEMGISLRGTETKEMGMRVMVERGRERRSERGWASVLHTYHDCKIEVPPTR
jgi:hypothetical protein